LPEPLLQVQDLHTYFDTPRGIVRAVDGVSFSVEKGETLAIVGESGCGKSMTALSLLQLVPEPAGYIAKGKILLRGKDLLELTWDEMRHVRGKELGIIFQEPMTSLNPVLTIGQQLIETVIVHGGTREEARRRSIELLGQVELPDPAHMLRRYPHELSGGMRQRVVIAIALANNPAVLLADEPTTALDVTVQAQILTLLARLQRDLGMAMVLITHDLGIVAEMADRVAVMYAGEIVECARTRDLFASPQHPYTRALFASLPSRRQRGQDLAVIEGIVPDPAAWPPGCRFEPRCPERFDPCPKIHPLLAEVKPEHSARCLLHPQCFPPGTTPVSPPGRSAEGGQRHE
jgi:oligopeptide/dipeptide ABC transporter ATP-binding protein